MKKVILDTSFILSSVRERIDFFENFELEGFQPLIPKQVISEVEGLLKSKKLKNRESANLALKLIKSHSFRKIDLKTKRVDNGIVKFAKANPSVIVATMDREIKRRIKNQKMVVRGKKKLEII